MKRRERVKPMGRYASKTDTNQKCIVSALRQAGCRVRDTSKVGKGFPDLLVYRPTIDRLFLLEVKDGSLPPSKGIKRLSQVQKDFHKEFPVAVVGSVEAALDAVGINW